MAPLTISSDKAYTSENIDTEYPFTIAGPAAANSAQPVPSIVVRTLSGAPSVASAIVSENFYQKTEKP